MLPLEQRDQDLSPRNLPAILNETFAIYARRLRPFLVLVAVVQVPLGLFLFAASWVLGGGEATFFVTLVLGALATAVLFGAAVVAVGQHYLTDTVDIRDCFVRASWRLITLVLLTAVGVPILLVFLAPLIFAGNPQLVVVVGVLMFPATALLVYFSVSIPSVIVEGHRASRALSRSIALIRGSWWRVFGYWLVILLVVQGLAIVSDLPFSLLLSAVGVSQTSAVFEGILGLGGTVVSIIVLPVLFISGTLLYYDLRVRKEAYDVSALSREMGIAAA